MASLRSLAISLLRIDCHANIAAARRACVFVNLAREPRFALWRPESVYDLVQRLRRELAGQVAPGWTPHWFRHNHATALLLAGVPVHVVLAGSATPTCRPR